LLLQQFRRPHGDELNPSQPPPHRHPKTIFCVFSPENACQAPNPLKLLPISNIQLAR
jgi:hypothetical protein